MNPILRDLPDCIESQRLLIRPPRPGDGAAINAAVLDSLAELRPWMPWAQQTPTVDDNEVYAREAHVRFLKREDLPFLIFQKESNIMVGRPISQSQRVRRLVGKAVNWVIACVSFGAWNLNADWSM